MRAFPGVIFFFVFRHSDGVYDYVCVCVCVCVCLCVFKTSRPQPFFFCARPHTDKHTHPRCAIYAHDVCFCNSPSSATRTRPQMNAQRHIHTHTHTHCRITLRLWSRRQKQHTPRCPSSKRPWGICLHPKPYSLNPPQYTHRETQTQPHTQRSRAGREC